MAAADKSIVVIRVLPNQVDASRSRIDLRDFPNFARNCSPEAVGRLSTLGSWDSSRMWGKQERSGGHFSLKRLTTLLQVVRWPATVVKRRCGCSIKICRMRCERTTRILGAARSHPHPGMIAAAAAPFDNGSQASYNLQSVVKRLSEKMASLRSCAAPHP